MIKISSKYTIIIIDFLVQHKLRSLSASVILNIQSTIWSNFYIIKKYFFSPLGFRQAFVFDIHVLYIIFLR